MQNLKEKQDKELELFNASFETKLLLKQFLDKVRRETAECVCDKMIGERRSVVCGLDRGYNTRIKEEKEIKKQIIKEL